MKHPYLLSSVAASILLGTTHANAFQSFEGDGFGDWQTTGSAFGISPVHGKLDGMEKPFTAYSNDSFALSAHGGDDATGTIVSPEFTIKDDHLVFLIAGGDQAGKTAVQLLVDDEVVLEATGNRTKRFEPVRWNLTRFKGKTARIRAVDDAKGEWGFIAADDFTLTDRPNHKAPPSTRGGEPFVDGLVSAGAIPGVTIPEGSDLQIQATFKEHQLKSPTALTFDEQGNVYLSETHRFRAGIEDDRNHLYWYLDDLQASDLEGRRKLHEKWKDKVSLEQMTANSELVRRLSDTDGDGKMDQSTVFADGFNDLLDGTAAGVFYYDGSLYFACIPKIYQLRDSNGDGKSDDRKVIQDGFGVRVSLSGHDLNGFTLGPDGRIYGTVGDRGFSFTTAEGKTYQYPNEGAAFRFEPDGSGFELMHTGLRNPKEIAFDKFGNAFSVDNNADMGDAARVVYLVEGGDSGWQMEHQAMHTFHREIGLEELPPNRWMAENMWQQQSDDQPAFILPPSDKLTAGPSGLTYHPGTGFLQQEEGRFLVCDYRGGAANSGIWSFSMEPEGAGMKMTDARQFAWGIAATDVEYSFDGRVFISDFVTGWKSHDDGRLVSLEAGENTYRAEEARETSRIIAEGFDQREPVELAKLLAHADSRVRLRAQVALTRKPGAVELFKKATESANQLERIHGIWGLGIVARRGSTPSPSAEFSAIPQKSVRESAAAALVTLLEDADPEIRTQALRVIGDASVGGDSLPLGKLLFDESPRVAFAAGIAIGKLKALGQYSALLDFLQKNDNQDVYLRHAAIYALQHIASDPRQISALASHESPAVRLAAVVALRRLNSEEVGRFINDAAPKVQDEAIRAVYDLDMNNLRPMVGALLDTLEKRQWTPFMLRRLIHNAYRSGTAEDAARLLKVIADSSLPEEVRQEALRLIGNWEKPFPADQFSGYWRPLEQRGVETIKPPLLEALPQLLAEEGFVLSGALGLVQHYDLDVASLDAGALKKIVRNGSLPADARATALVLYLENGGEGIEEFLSQMATDTADVLAITALENLAKRNPAAALAPLEAAIDSNNHARAQKAWTVLAPIKGEEVASFIVKHLDALRELKGVSPSAIELLAAARTREEPAVKEALAAYETAIAENGEPLASFNIALQGGDPASGASLFTSHPTGQCMRCHKAEDKAHSAGGDAGPNLAGIAVHHDRAYFLQSMVLPGAVVAPGYGIVAVTFKNGATLSGNLLAETPDQLDIATPEKAYRIKRSDIASSTPPVSAMPSMEHLLKPEEMRDLIAWLDTLKEEPEKAKLPEPETVDPTKLPGARPQSSINLSKQTLVPVATGATPAQAAAPHEQPPVRQNPAVGEEPSIQEHPAPVQESTPLQEAGPDNQVPPSLEPAPALEPSPLQEPEANDQVAPASEDQVKLGKQQYLLCGACHGQEGGGGPAAPPLANSEWVNGPVENLIRIQLRGLIGPIRVAGQDYDFPAGMPPMAFQSDEQIAAVLTYVRSNFGNDASPVAPEQVAALRDEVGQPALQASELIAPPPAGPAPELAVAAPPRDAKYDDMEVTTGLPFGVMIALASFLLLCVVGAFRR